MATLFTYLSLKTYLIGSRMKKVSGRALRALRPFRALGDNRAEAEKDVNETKMRETDSKKRALETESARAVPVGKYTSLDWLIRRWNPSRRMEEPPSLVRKKPSPKGRPAQLPGRGNFRFRIRSICGHPHSRGRSRQASTARDSCSHRSG
jgi:hypothetical protein